MQAELAVTSPLWTPWVISGRSAAREIDGMKKPPMADAAPAVAVTVAVAVRNFRRETRKDIERTPSKFEVTP
jgi:hypothetical protein